MENRAFVGDRRKHVRVPARFPLKHLLLQKSPQKLQRAQSLDFSVAGMRFHSFKFVPHNAKVLIELVPPNQVNPVRVISEVVHTQEHPEGDHFTVGIKFEHILK